MNSSYKFMKGMKHRGIFDVAEARCAACRRCIVGRECCSRRAAAAAATDSYHEIHATHERQEMSFVGGSPACATPLSACGHAQAGGTADRPAPATVPAEGHAPAWPCSDCWPQRRPRHRAGLADASKGTKKTRRSLSFFTMDYTESGRTHETHRTRLHSTRGDIHPSNSLAANEFPGNRR